MPRGILLALSAASASIFIGLCGATPAVAADFWPGGVGGDSLPSAPRLFQLQVQTPQSPAAAKPEGSALADDAPAQLSGLKADLDKLRPDYVDEAWDVNSLNSELLDNAAPPPKASHDA